MTLMVKYLQKLLESPIVGHLGTCDENHQLFRTMLFSAAVIENPARIVLHISEVGMAYIRNNLRISNYAAVVIVDAVTYESVQIKGSTTIRPITNSEDSYFDRMLQRLAALNYPERLFTMRHKPLVALEMNIVEIYNQTPGIGAGERLVFE